MVQNSMRGLILDETPLLVMSIVHENFLIKMIHLNLFLKNPPLQFTPLSELPVHLVVSSVVTYIVPLYLFACLFLLS